MSNHGCDCCNKIRLVPRRVVFEKPGNTVWSVPQDGWYKVYVTGGGGAGGNAYLLPETINIGEKGLSGGAGGGGGTGIKDIYLTKGTPVSVVVGAGSDPMPGNMNLGAYAGTTGGSSSFGIYVSATGGQAGESRSHTNSWGASNRPGGIGVGGDFNFSGHDGNGHCFGTGPISAGKDHNSVFFTSAGGASYWGATGLHRKYYAGDGENGTSWGTGGSGGRALMSADTMYYGGKGADGVVIIEWTEVQ